MSDTELKVGGWRTGGVKEEGTPVPVAKKNLPHIYVHKELSIKIDVTEATADPSSQIYYALKESSVWNGHLTCKLEGANRLFNQYGSYFE